MTYTNYIYLFAGLALFAFTSCEDVIDLDIDETAPQLVVDAWINSSAELQTIRLTNSTPYFDPAAAPGVTGATVTVTSSIGNVFNFSDQNNGDYVWASLMGDSLGGPIGTVYELSIELAGKTYRSATTLNRSPVIDSIGQEVTEENAFSKERIDLNFYARDPQGQGDTYWIKTFKNGIFQAQPSEINIAYDAGFSPGSEVDGFVFITPIRDNMNPDPAEAADGEKANSPWAVGDIARVEIHSISNEAYFFLDIVQTQLLNSTNTIFAEPLSNTKGNVVQVGGDDEVLGMFVMSEVRALEYEVQ